MENLTIGIDLGTTNSCISFYHNGKLKILENKEGDKTTPSFIFFPDPLTTVVGKNGKNMADLKPEFGIYEVKRLIGRKFNDSYVQNILQFLSFEVEPDSSNNPLVVMRHRNKTVKKTPQELCTIILQKLRSDIYDKFNTEVNTAVITVPAYFNVTQRETTLAAAKDAGFTFVKLFNEPTAAALSYDHEFGLSEDSYSLVYDLGGGTFDVSVLKKSKNSIRVLGVDGDTQLGGQDLDNLIMKYVISELKRKFDYCPDKDLKKDAVRRIRNKCEEAKQMLSSLEEAPITLTGIIPHHASVHLMLTRKEFEMLAEKLFQQTILIVDRCLKKCKIHKSSIKEIILAGGSTRIPKIRQMIFDYFDGKPPNKLINADECVAEGAALRAAMLSTNSRQSIKKIRFTDVVPLSLGLADFVGAMNFIIKKNTPIPAAGSDVFETCETDQDDMTFKIFEGERLDVRKNRFLAELTVSNITRAPVGQCKVRVCMNVDENGILTVTAKEMIKNIENRLSVIYDDKGRTDSEIQEQIIDAEQNAQEDERFRIFAESKRFLLQYCSAVIDNLIRQNLNETYSAAFKACSDAKDLAESFEINDEVQISACIRQCRLYCEDIINRHKFSSIPSKPHDDI